MGMIAGDSKKDDQYGKYLRDQTDRRNPRTLKIHWNEYLLMGWSESHLSLTLIHDFHCTNCTPSTNIHWNKFLQIFSIICLKMAPSVIKYFFKNIINSLLFVQYFRFRSQMVYFSNTLDCTIVYNFWTCTILCHCHIEKRLLKVTET